MVKSNGMLHHEVSCQLLFCTEFSAPYGIYEVLQRYLCLYFLFAGMYNIGHIQIVPTETQNDNYLCPYNKRNQ